MYYQLRKVFIKKKIDVELTIQLSRRFLVFEKTEVIRKIVNEFKKEIKKILQEKELLALRYVLLGKIGKDDDNIQERQERQGSFHLGVQKDETEK